MPTPDFHRLRVCSGTLDGNLPSHEGGQEENEREMRGDSTKLLPLLRKKTKVERRTWTGRSIRRVAAVFVAAFWLALGAIIVYIIA